jgi:hypothetical protein
MVLCALQGFMVYHARFPYCTRQEALGVRVIHCCLLRSSCYSLRSFTYCLDHAADLASHNIAASSVASCLCASDVAVQPVLPALCASAKLPRCALIGHAVP